MPRKKEKRDDGRSRNGHDSERRYVARKRECPLCQDKKITPSYKDTGFLSRFISDRGKIISRGRTGMCSKHQRAVTREIKRARHLVLLPFVVGPQ